MNEWMNRPVNQSILSRPVPTGSVTKRTCSAVSVDGPALVAALRLRHAGAHHGGVGGAGASLVLEKGILCAKSRSLPDLPGRHFTLYN